MQSRAIDQNNFLKKHPLNFLLFYGDYEVVNTIYLEDGSPLVDLSMELFNQSTDQTVKLLKPTNSSASEENCHFYLSLEGDFTLGKVPEGWDIKVIRSQKNTGDNLYFLRKEKHDLQPKPANGSTNKIVLTLGNFRASPEGGTRTIRAEMFYGPLLKDKNNQPFQDNFGQYSSYGNTIFITNNRGGKKTLPLQVGFSKGNAVINDGTSTNSLELFIANKNWPTSNLPLSTDSQFEISFEMGGIDKEGAVATDTQVKAINITSPSNKWGIPDNGDSTEWPVKLNSGTPQLETPQLASDEVIKLNITNLVTNHFSGSGYLYVRYKNIPNSPDGQFVVPIEKMPLLYGNNEIITGINNPLAKLQVVGSTSKVEVETTEVMRLLRHGQKDVKNANSVGLKVGSCEASLTGKTQLDIALAGTAQGSNSWGSAPDVTVMSLVADGKVGIGTTIPSDKLHVDGNIRLSGTINGADQTMAIYSNTTALKSNAWIELWGKASGDSNRIGELSLAGKYIEFFYNSTDSSYGSVGMRLASDGKLGIGITSPSATLHVNGRIKDKTGWVMPVGTILPYAGAGANPPEGWLLCNGTQLDKTAENNKYKDLFDVIGYSYSQIKSGNNFKVPNLQGRIPVGVNSSDSHFDLLGKEGGSKTVTLTIAQMPSHNHNFSDPGHSHTIVKCEAGWGDIGAFNGSRLTGSECPTNHVRSGITFDAQGSNQAHENLQPYLTVNYIIKF
jgi:microcystin-dependent protein